MLLLHNVSDSYGSPAQYARYIYNRSLVVLILTLVLVRLSFWITNLTIEINLTKEYFRVATQLLLPKPLSSHNIVHMKISFTIVFFKDACEFRIFFLSQLNVTKLLNEFLSMLIFSATLPSITWGFIFVILVLSICQSSHSYSWKRNDYADFPEWLKTQPLSIASKKFACNSELWWII